MLAETTARPIHAPAGATSHLAGDDTARSRSSRLPVAALATVGGTLTMVGGVAPWLSFFAGLQPLHGIDGPYGLLLVALGALTVVTAGVHVVRGGTADRWLLGGMGFAILAISGVLGITLLAEFMALAADPLLVARLEPGLGVTLLGGSMIAATLFVPVDGTQASGVRQSVTASDIALAGLLLVAGIIHLALTPEHLAESTRLGIGFLAFGIVQTVLGPLLLLARTRAVAAVALLVSLASALALLAAVTVGLPVLGHGHVAGVIGPVETLDDLAAVTLVAEVIAVILALRLLRRIAP